MFGLAKRNLSSLFVPIRFRGLAVSIDGGGARAASSNVLAADASRDANPVELGGTAVTRKAMKGIKGAHPGSTKTEHWVDGEEALTTKDNVSAKQRAKKVLEAVNEAIFSDEIKVARPRKKSSQKPHVVGNDSEDVVFSDEATTGWVRKKPKREKERLINGETEGGKPIVKRSESKMTPTPFEVDIEQLDAEIRRVKKETFGIEGHFREYQLEATVSACLNRHVMCVIPTGTGKSIIYQIPAMLRPPLAPGNGPTIVIAPLKALMDDQAKFLRTKNTVKFGVLHGDVEFLEKVETIENFAKLDLILATPEQLHNKRVLKALEGTNPRRFVFDEAHCIFEWGETFRPKYRSACSMLRHEFPKVPWTLLTATAPPNVQRFLTGLLGVENLPLLDIYIARDNLRPNLEYAVRPKRDNFIENMNMLQLALEGEPCSIVYGQTRDECETVAKELEKRLGSSVAVYHAGMSASAKKANLVQWQMGIAKIMIATSAFGMGVNFNAVRKVIHYSMPLSITNYIQQCGRAGRDGLPSECILFYSDKDAKRARFIIAEARGLREDLDEMETFCKSSGCVKKFLQEKLDGKPTDRKACKKDCPCRAGSGILL